MKKKDNHQLIGDVLQKVLHYYRLSSGVDRVRIRQIWDDNMGPVIARHTNSVHLNGNTLMVELDSPALRQELSYGKEKIRDIINKGLGKRAVEKVILR